MKIDAKRNEHTGAVGLKITGDMLSGITYHPPAPVNDPCPGRSASLVGNQNF